MNMVWPRFIQLNIQYQWQEFFDNMYNEDDSFNHFTYETTAHVTAKINFYNRDLESDHNTGTSISNEQNPETDSSSSDSD